MTHRGIGGGSPCQVHESVWEVWRQGLQTQTKQHWTSAELAAEFASLTGIRYSPSHWHFLLKEREGLYYYKPRPRDYRRDDGAEERLGERIQATFDALQAMGYKPEAIGWGFADETAGQLHSNNCRFWAFEPGLCRVVNTNRSSCGFFGFYGMNAVSHLVELADGKVPSIKSALLEVKAKQVDKSALVIFWDNASSHKALETWGWENQIYFVSLPAYSPDLNPIEKIWKWVKRWINQAEFIKELPDLIRLFKAGFERVSHQLTFTDGWWETYQDKLSWYSPIFNSNTSP